MRCDAVGHLQERVRAGEGIIPACKSLKRLKGAGMKPLRKQQKLFLMLTIEEYYPVRLTSYCVAARTVAGNFKEFVLVVLQQDLKSKFQIIAQNCLKEIL